MMKAIRSITRVAMLLCALWLFASWAEVVCKNTQVEPQYNKYNAFVLLTQQEEMKSSAEMAGSPLRLAEGVVTHIDGNTLTIVTTEDGEEWLAEAIEIRYALCYNIIVPREWTPTTGKGVFT